MVWMAVFTAVTSSRDKEADTFPCVFIALKFRVEQIEKRSYKAKRSGMK
jgi:hypothetical protein